MRKSPNLKTPPRVIPAISIASFLAFVLAACGGGSSSGSAGSATSADITWWGWTPTSQVAEQYIKAFNEQYPNIHVTYKMLTIAGYNAALRPALASTVGPDVFDVAPGGANGSVETYSPGRGQPGPRGREGARQRLAVQALPDRRLQPDGRREARGRLGRGGVLRDGLDQREPVQPVQPQPADHPRAVDQ